MNVNKECTNCAANARAISDVTSRFVALTRDVEKVASELIIDTRSTSARLHGARLYKATFRAVTDLAGDHDG